MNGSIHWMNQGGMWACSHAGFMGLCAGCRKARREHLEEIKNVCSQLTK